MNYSWELGEGSTWHPQALRPLQTLPLWAKGSLTPQGFLGASAPRPWGFRTSVRVREMGLGQTG